jgi:AcrR family transcriptional regulator
MNAARERILAAAQRIHRAQGLGALSLRAVARDVGITPMAIYRHFQDKDALVMALVEAGFAKLEGYFAEAIRTRSPRKAIERALIAYAEFALAEPNMFELMFLVRRPSVPDAPASLRSSPSPSFEALIAAVREVLQDGSRATDDAGEVMLMCWATIHGLVTLHFTGRFGHDDARFWVIYRRAVKRLLAMLDT